MKGWLVVWRWEASVRGFTFLPKEDGDSRLCFS